MIDREVRILLHKEWRQLTASRSAVATSVLVPFFALLVMPMFLVFTLRNAPPEAAASGAGVGIFAEVGSDPKRLPIALLPLVVAMVGIILPTALVTQLVIGERESRTLELLVALPVRIDQLLRAKLAAVVLATFGITAPLVAIDAIVFLATGIAGPADVLGLPILLVCVLGFSTSAALLIALLAHDFRTANNVAGFILVPALLVSMAVNALLPAGIIRPLVLAGLFAVGGFGLARVALRVVTFERLMR